MFIYKIVNKVNGIMYVGISNNVEKRFESHKRKMYDKRYTNKKLYKAMREFKPKNFFVEVIEETSDKNRESYWIKQLNTIDNGYNHFLNGEKIQDNKIKFVENDLTKNQFLLHMNDLNEEMKQFIIDMYIEGNGKRYISKKTNVSERTVNEIVKDVIRKKRVGIGRKTILKIDIEGNIVAKYRGLKKAQESCSFGKYGILKVLHGKRNMAGGFYWKYDE